MDKRAILKALVISAFVATITLAVLGGYSTTTNPEGVTTHHYTFSWFGWWIFLLGIFVVPITLLIGYPSALLLYHFKIFNIYSVSLIGVVSTLAVVSLLFSKFPPPLMQSIFYGIGGLVAAITAFYSYQNITSKGTGRSKARSVL